MKHLFLILFFISQLNVFSQLIITPGVGNKNNGLILGDSIDKIFHQLGKPKLTLSRSEYSIIYEQFNLTHHNQNITFYINFDKVLDYSEGNQSIQYIFLFKNKIVKIDYLIEYDSKELGNIKIENFATILNSKTDLVKTFKNPFVNIIQPKNNLTFEQYIYFNKGLSISFLSTNKKATYLEIYYPINTSIEKSIQSTIKQKIPNDSFNFQSIQPSYTIDKAIYFAYYTIMEDKNDIVSGFQDANYLVFDSDSSCYYISAGNKNNVYTFESSNYKIHNDILILKHKLILLNKNSFENPETFKIIENYTQYYAYTFTDSLGMHFRYLKNIDKNEKANYIFESYDENYSEDPIELIIYKVGNRY